MALLALNSSSRKANSASGSMPVMTVATTPSRSRARPGREPPGEAEQHPRMRPEIGRRVGNVGERPAQRPPAQRFLVSARQHVLGRGGPRAVVDRGGETQRQVGAEVVAGRGGL